MVWFNYSDQEKMQFIISVINKIVMQFSNFHLIFQINEIQLQMSCGTPIGFLSPITSHLVLRNEPSHFTRG